MHKLLYYFRRSYRLAKNQKSLIAIGILWLLTIFAISNVWHTNEPTVRVRRIVAPAKAAVLPISWIPLAKHDGISTVSKKRVVINAGIVKRSGVQLTKKQATFVSKFGQYLKSIGEYAVVTSGARSPQHQLGIIKSKILSLGASRKFPELRRAAVSRPSTWLRAWTYLRSMHVPVYAPNTAGGEASASNHIKGLAVDVISGSLDHLRNLVSDFSHSIFARKSPLQVASIAREPGCVHINLKG